MKKVFTLLFVLFFCAGLTVNAQLFATFEDDADELINWGAFPGWLEAPRFVEGGLPQAGSNPDKTGLNKSDKCLLAINIAEADWWGNFVTLTFIEPITITESNRYLRYMAYRSIQPKSFRVAFNGEQDEHQLFQGKTAKDGEWVGMVADVLQSPWAKALIAQEKDVVANYMKIIFSTNWSDPRTGWGVATYAFDNFELCDDPLPPGVALLDGTGLNIGFESPDEMNQWLNTIDMQNDVNEYEIIDNPFTSSSVNNGGKIFQLDKSDKAVWWQGPRFEFNGVVPVDGTTPEYVHVMVYVPGEVFADGTTVIDIQLCAKDHMGNENNMTFQVWDDEADEWMDLVMEIDKIAYLSELTVRFDVRRNEEGTGYINSPANTYYLDAIAFDDDPNPRTEIISGLPKITVKTFADIISVPGAIRINTRQNAKIEVFNVIGGLTKLVPAAIGNSLISVEKGIYVVKITSATGEKQIAKVMVR